MKYPSYPPALSKDQQEYLTSHIKDWSIAHGLAVRPSPAVVPPESDARGSLAITAPVTLFPSLFPRKCFHEGLVLQKAYNQLYSAIARDEEWLARVVKDLVDIDDFISKLWDVHIAVKKEGYAQDLALGLFRSDYMVHVDPENPDQSPHIKQVEFNTISSSFGGLSSRVSSLHKYLLSIAAYPNEAASIIGQHSLQSNAAIESLATGLAKSHAAYGQSKTSKTLCILVVIQDNERNVFDQKHLEYALFSHHRVRTFRLPFSRTLIDTKLAQDRALIYTPPAFPDRAYEVTTVYFRAGYSPDDYPNPDSWSARLHLEKSAAVKCPSILTHLAGSKKIQQILATPGSSDLARFVPGKGIADRLLKTFAPIYPLDSSEAGMKARELATNPETAVRYVLKPQREGGGNNIYRKAIPGFLKSIPESHWPAYILMEMIEPPAQENYVFRNGELQQGGVICELGIFGTCLWRNGKGGDDKGEVLENEEAGHLLRTKGNQSEEGGVAAGFGAVDSVCLVDV